MSTMSTIERIIVNAPGIWYDRYRVTIITRHRTGTGVWDGAGDTPREALAAAALSAGIPTPVRVLPSGDTVRAYTPGEWS